LPNEYDKDRIFISGEGDSNTTKFEDQKIK